MKCVRTPIEATVEKYEVDKHLEDGYELWADVITKAWIVTDSIIKITQPDGKIVCPYIMHRRGRTFIQEGDYIIVEDDGTKHVCGGDKIFERYQEIK